MSVFILFLMPFAVLWVAFFVVEVWRVYAAIKQEGRA